MTFNAREYSAEDGAPVLLATFALGEKLWRFARADQDLTHAGNTYLAPAGGLEPSRLQDTSETRKNDVSITVDRAFPIAELWRVSPPAGIVAVQLLEIHEDEDEDAVAWLGHVSNVSWIGDAKAEINLSPGALALRTNGLRRLWQKSCSHVLYGPKCLLPRAGHEAAATLLDVDGTWLEAAAFDNGMKFNGGFIEWTDVEGITDWRAIIEHTGTLVRLMTHAPRLEAGMVVTAVEGCDRTIARCVELENSDNFGGIPYFITKNPFSGDPIF
jgi:uncharacterized phage protein (TIGR02218 family)